MLRGLETSEEEKTVQVVLFDSTMGPGMEFWENEATKVRCWQYTLGNSS